MTLLELTKIFSGKYPADAKEMKVVDITKDDMELFREMLKINPVYVQGFKSTEKSGEFYSAFALFDKVFPAAKKEEVFYASKLGYFFPGVPSKLVYILKGALHDAGSPNLAIESLNVSSMTDYLCRGPLPNGVTLQQIMSNLLGSNFKLLTSARRRVKYKTWWEVYVPDKDRVCMLPEDIATTISSRDDLLSINYNASKGVCVYDTPIRTLCGRVGVVKNDFDLREVI